MRLRFLLCHLTYLMVFLSVWTIAGFPDPAGAQEDQRTIVILGSGVSPAGDEAEARQAAIANGLAAAVGNAAQSMLSPEEMRRRFKDLDDLIFRHAEKFISRYQVLTQSQTGQQHRVLLEVTVDVDKIHAQLNTYGVAESRPEIPTLLLLIAEQNIDDYAPRFWWGSGQKGVADIAMESMIGSLRAQGLKVLTPKEVRGRDDVDWKRYNKAELTFREAASLGSGLGADLVIVGNSLAVPSSAEVGSDMQALKGSVSAHVIDAENAEQVTKISQTALGMHADEVEAGAEALSNAGRLAGQALSRKIIQAWQTSSVRTARIGVVVEGTRNLVHFVKFRRALTALEGVEKVHIKEMGTNTAALVVDFKGSGQQLADALKNQSFGSFGIQLIEVRATDVKLALVAG
jgi:hypothetical protein